MSTSASPCPPRPQVYRPRQPKTTTFYQIVSGHAKRLEAVWEDRFQERYGPLRRVVPKTFDAYLRCGILDCGFARIKCESCREEYLLAYSCKTRCACPSCAKKRQVVFSRFLADEVLEPVPHRQVVFTVPKRIRPFFFSKRKRLARLSRAAYLTVREALRKACIQPDGQPGAVASIQTFGSLLDGHPHIHLLISWGVFSSDGRFHQPTLGSEVSSEKLNSAFRERVFDFLLKDQAIDLDVVENMRSWPHSGFGTFVGSTIDVPEDREGRPVVPDALLSYFVRAPVALTRIRLTPEGKVRYEADRFHPKHNANFREFDPLEFLALVALHIPDPNDRLVASSGWYSNRSRGLRRKNTPLVEDVSGLGPPLAAAPREPREDRDRSSRYRWARLIQFIYEADPLRCPKCGGMMRIIAWMMVSQYRLLDRPHIHKERNTQANPATLMDCSWAGGTPPLSIQDHGGSPGARVLT